MDTILKLAAVATGVLVLLGVVPGLAWPVRLRVLAAILFGMVSIGIVARPFLGAAGNSDILTAPSVTHSILLIGLSFLVGFVCFFMTWPYGSQMAPLAVPAGLTVWAVCSPAMSSALFGAGDIAEKATVYRNLLPDGFFWLVVVLAGLAGGIVAGKVSGKSQSKHHDESKSMDIKVIFRTTAVGLIASCVIAYFVVTLLAQDVRLGDTKLSSVIAQPSTGQIGFAVFVAFTVASFVVKKTLRAGYIWPIIATAIVSAFGLWFHSRNPIIEYLSSTWPASFFASAHSAILPVQMVAFGALGAIAGYWLVESYEFWRAQEAESE